MKLMRSLLAVASMAVWMQGVQAADKLPTDFKIDAAETSVSGLSSGAFMAAQLQVAYSASIKGSGIVAGGPYMCAAGNMAFAGICMGQSLLTAPNPSPMALTAQGLALAGQIDRLNNLKSRRIYVFSGTQDTVVKSKAVDATVGFFQRVGVPAANLKYVNNVPAGHAVITPGYGNDCAANEKPFISHCNVDGQGYDQAGALLTHIYGAAQLKPKADAPKGQLITFNQRAFAAPITGMAEEAYLYVPQDCAGGKNVCKVHVAIHGCMQSAATVGNQFVTDTGYNEWADTNRMLVLYPQVNATGGPMNPIGYPLDPMGCWDWTGYTGANYATRSGLQMTAIMDMVKALGSNR